MARKKPPKHKMMTEDRADTKQPLSEEEIAAIEDAAERKEEERRRQALIRKAIRRRYKDVDYHREGSRWLTPDEIAAKDEAWE